MKKITILLFAVAAFGAGCKKFTNINTNPNQPTVVTPNVVLSAALQGSGAELAGGFFNTPRWMGAFARSGNFIQTIPVETYNEAADYADGDWQAIYNILGRYNYIEHNNGGDPFYIGVGKTMKALHFSTLIDGFGNVPYSQAFNLSKFPNPKYDDAATIYKDLLLQLDSAVVEFNLAKTQYYPTASGTVRTNDDKYDIMFGRGAGGSSNDAAGARMLVWIRFANTVKLRLLMTESDVLDAGTIHAELAKITANGQGYIGANQGAAVNPGYADASAAQQNPLFGIFINTAGNRTNSSSFNRANQYFINFCNNTGDDRVTDVYDAVGGKYVGNYDGDPNSLPNTSTSTIGANLLSSATQDQWILSDFESLFWQAEAVQKGFTEVSSSSAADLARMGTEQSYVFLNDEGDPADDIDFADNVFLAGDAGDPKTDVSVGGLQAIMTLKWAALIGVNWEQSYTDYRRTGFPVPDGSNFGFTHAPGVVKHNGAVAIPYRYIYPQSEINTNGKNVPTGITEYTPIFWDKREK